MNRTWWIRGGLVAAALILITILAASPPARAALQLLVEWVQDLGAWGPLAIIAAFMICAPLLIPTLPLSLGAGFLYGPGLGLATAMAGITLGAVTAQVSGRVVASRLERHLRSPKWARIVDAVAAGGFKLLVLLRMSYLFPYTWMNYAIALSRASLPANAAATALGMAPMMVLQVYAASMAHDLTEALERGVGVGPFKWILLAGGLMISVGVMVHVARLTRRTLG